MRMGIVTGAGGELGRAMCLKLAREGWHVVATDVDVGGLEATRAATDAVGGRIEVDQLDVRSGEQWTRLRDRLAAASPHLDLLLNCAGVCASGKVENMPLAEWDRLFEINFRGTLLGCQTFLPWLRRHPSRSHLVNVASITGMVPFPRLAAYNASKAAVISLSETLYDELRSTPVAVTAVCPTVVRSNLVTGMRHYDPDGLYGPVVQSIAASSWITPDMVAAKTYAGMIRGRSHVLIGVRAMTLYHLRRALGSGFFRIYRRCFWPESLRNAP